MRNCGGSLLHVSVREVLRSEHFHVWWRSCVAVPRLPVDARTSPQPFLTCSTRCMGVPSGLCALLFEFCAACSAYCTSSCGVRRCRRSRWNSDPAERGRRSGTSAVSPFRETCLPAYGSFRSPTSSGRAVYPRLPSLYVARWMDVGRRSRCIYAAGDLALISLRVSLLLPLSSRGLYQH
jgi:hypothetical protein